MFDLRTLWKAFNELKAYNEAALSNYEKYHREVNRLILEYAPNGMESRTVVTRKGFLYVAETESETFESRHQELLEKYPVTPMTFEKPALMPTLLEIFQREVWKNNTGIAKLG